MVGTFVIEKTYHLVYLLSVPPENVEYLYVEVNIRKKKWLLCYTYNPHKNNMFNHLYHLNKSLDAYLKHCNTLLFEWFFKN